MTRTELLEAVVRLGREFRKRGLTRQLRPLRLFFLAAKHGLLDARNVVELRFSEGLVVEWLKTLRLPPYERALMVLPKGAPCPSCGPSQGTVPSTRTEFVFDGGYRVRCSSCGLEWIVLE